MMGDDGGRQGTSNVLLNTSKATRWAATWRPNALKYKQRGQVTRVRDQENEGLIALNTSEVGDEAESRDERESLTCIDTSEGVMESTVEREA